MSHALIALDSNKDRAFGVMVFVRLKEDKMTLEQALLKIIELQDEIIRLKNQVVIQPQPYVVNPFIYRPPDLCTDGGFHEYPSPWMSTTPPNCKKCGQQAQSNHITSVFTTNKASGEIE